MTEEIQIGTVLNSRYKIQQELGQGGMGAVYLAQDLQHRRQVAIKVARLAGLEARDQFRREAAFLKRLHHHSLPRVWDYFSDTQRDFLVMEYIPGEDLETLVYRKGPQPEWLVLRWADELLDGLDYLHTQDPPLVHRDIKPGNLKLRTDETLVLVDFGIATELRPGRNTDEGALAVTPGFSPPEQYSDKPTDARTDIYSVGATLYFLLTGLTPPPAIERVEGRATLQAPSDVLPAVSSACNMLVRKALNLRHEDRWASAAEMRHAAGYASQHLAARTTDRPDVGSQKPLRIDSANATKPRKDRRRLGIAILLILLVVSLSAAGLLALNATETSRSGVNQPTTSDQAAAANETPTASSTVTLTSTPGTEMAVPLASTRPIALSETGAAPSSSTVFNWQPILAIDEDFQQSSSTWPTGGSEGVSWGVRDGDYRLAVNQPNTLLSIPLDIAIRDFEASLEGRVLAGGDGVRFGMQFRAGDDSLYRLDFLPGIGMELSKRVDGVSTILQERLPVAGKDPSQVVRLGVVASGPKLQMLFEDQVIAEIIDNSLERGDISLYTVSGPNGNSEVAFSRFQMEPGSSEQIPLTIWSYDDPDGRFTLLAPETWRQSADMLGESFDDLQHLARVVVIAVNDAQPGDSPMDVARKAVAQAAPFYPDFVLGSGKDVEINGLPAYEQTLHGQVLGVDVNARLIAMGENAPGYALVSVVPASNDAVMQPVMDYVLASFHATDQVNSASDNGQVSVPDDEPRTSTPIPTSTRIPTRSSPTKEPTRAATATRIPTRTSNAASATPRPQAATATPATASGSYAAPTLRGPADGSTFNGPDAQIVFQWDSVGSLGQSDYYVLTILFPHSGQTWQDVQWTKGTSLAIPNYIYGAATLPGTLQWNVIVMRQTGTKADGQKEGTEFGSRSATRRFDWTPGGGSDGGGGGGGTLPPPTHTPEPPPP